MNTKNEGKLKNVHFPHDINNESTTVKTNQNNQKICFGHNAIYYRGHVKGQNARFLK